MSYAPYGNIASFDYNTLVGSNPSTSSGALNTVWDEVAVGYGATVSVGSSTTVTIQAPETTYLANSWGSIGITGTVFGS